MKTYTLKTIKELLEKDYKTRPNNKSSNMPLIQLIDLINKPTNEISIIETKGTALNRGVIAECLIKMYFNKLDKSAWASSGSDFTHKGIEYEVKYSSAKGYAHYNPAQNMENLIFMDRFGIYLTNGKNVILDKCKKHIQTINKANATALLVF